MQEFIYAHLNETLIVFGAIFIIGGIWECKYFKDEPLSLMPFCGAMTIFAGVLALIPGLFFDL